MVYYEAWLRLKSEPEEPVGPFKSSAPFDAATPEEARALAMDWMKNNVPEHDEASELWLHEGTAKTKIWP